MILCFRLSNQDAASDLFFKDFYKKCKDPYDLFKTPFNNKRILIDDEGFGMFRMDIGWFPFHYYGLMGIVVSSVLGLSWGWFVLPVFMSLLGIFWCPLFYLLMFKISLLRAKSKASIKWVSASSFLDAYVKWDK